MKKGIRGRVIFILLTVFASILFFLPSTPVYSKLPSWWGKVFPSKGITLGLDLQGGMHLVLEVQGEKAVDNTVERTVAALKGALESKNLALQSIRREGRDILLSFAPENKEAVSKLVEEQYPNFMTKQSGPGEMVLTLRDAEVKRILESSTSQALETIRNRIDQFGVAEPLIQRQGANQILVQLPGVKEPDRAIALIGRTALLEFKLVDDESPIARQLPSQIEADQEAVILQEYQGKIPPDDQILFERDMNKETNKVTKRPFVVKRQAALAGDLLSDARVSMGQFNEPYVAITFDPVGAKLFEKVTEENRRHRLAIVLDNTVYSAPVIQEKIAGGRAQISGSFTVQQANDLAIVLRAGSLPAPVTIIQNVTVGPSLGQDSIENGLKAGVIGTLLVVVFMIFYYRFSGLVADFTLVLNVVLLIGALAAMNATLTLPGIAGIILTVGMAVDSNVLIFERIREELRAGKPVRLAVNAGYDKAFLTIVDSHVTTLITAFVLFMFGTGPIKGFAVTLSLGVIINLFTSLVGTKVVYDVMISRRKMERLSI
ncbi:MAG: protein translocase subunit SecD [Candidatus Manganitrophaceae bacterium]|nr:MAG: protein translocase subunit SecD [Candidatus Manganitrophaceae bacterium]